jgi:hypothetical protein
MEAAAAFSKDQLAIDPPRVVDAPLRTRGAPQDWRQLDAKRALDCSAQALSRSSVAVEQMGENLGGLVLARSAAHRLNKGRCGQG